MTLRRHFIAGARCPHCNALDKVRLCREDGREWIECVACGHVSDNPGDPEHPSPEGEVGIVRLGGQSRGKPD